VFLLANSCNGITDQGIKTLGEDFKGLRSLQSLHLMFYECKNMTDEGLNNLSECMHRMNCLEPIFVDFESIEMRKGANS